MGLNPVLLAINLLLGTIAAAPLDLNSTSAFDKRDAFPILGWDEVSGTWISPHFCGVDKAAPFSDWQQLRLDSDSPFTARNQHDLEHIHLFGGLRVNKIKAEWFDVADAAEWGGRGGAQTPGFMQFRRPANGLKRIYPAWMSVGCCKYNKHTRVCFLEFGDNNGYYYHAGKRASVTGEISTVAPACCRILFFSGERGVELDAVQTHWKKNLWYDADWQAMPGAPRARGKVPVPPKGHDDDVWLQKPPPKKRSLKENEATLRSDRVIVTRQIGLPHDETSMVEFDDSHLWQEHYRISKLTLYCGQKVNGIKLDYDNVKVVNGTVNRENSAKFSELHGTTDGEVKTMDFIAGDYIHGIDLSSCAESAKGESAVCGATIHSYSTRTLGCGKHNNADFKHYQLYTEGTIKHSVLGFTGSVEKETGALKSLIPQWIPESDHH